jgi:hypothetical protein
VATRGKTLGAAWCNIRYAPGFWFILDWPFTTIIRDTLHEGCHGKEEAQAESSTAAKKRHIVAIHDNAKCLAGFLERDPQAPATNEGQQ